MRGKGEKTIHPNHCEKKYAAKKGEGGEGKKGKTRTITEKFAIGAGPNP